MYMSRVILNPARRETMRALAEPQLFHGAIEQSFSMIQERRLWRVDWFNGQCSLLLVSVRQPDLTALVSQFGFPDSKPLWETRSYDPLLNGLQEGQLFQFRLRANPVTSSKNSKESLERGRIYAHVTQLQQKEWLQQRAEKHGFSLSPEGFDVVHTQWLRFSKRGGPMVSIRSAAFEGRLRVENAQLFRDALINGIGRAKAYGCGMLTIARISSIQNE